MGGLISILSNITEAVQYLSAITISFILGALTVVGVVLYLFHEYTKSIYPPVKSKVFKNMTTGKLLHDNLQSENSERQPETCRFINMIIFFVFNEWRNSTNLHKWVLKKINVELMELMETKAASRFLQSLKVHEIELGNNLPIIHGVTMDDPRCQIDGPLPDNLTIDVDVEYDGKLRLAVDVDLVFGKTAFVSIRIKYLKGSVRVQFSRFPCANWSVCFVEEPEIKFEVDTSFESRQLPQLGSLIVNQIRRTIRKKHTFPHYKLRYTPFFSFQHIERHSADEVNEIRVNLTSVGVVIAACTRLLIPKDTDTNAVVFATVSLDGVSCEEQPLLDEDKAEKSFFGSPQKGKPEINNAGKENRKTFERKRLFSTFPNSSTKNEKITSTSELLKLATPNTSEPTPDLLRVSTPKRRIKLRKVVPSTLSYLMVTRNFSATLHELPSLKPDGEAKTSVHVKSLTENRSPYKQSGIHAGDRIQEINGTEILSLSQAVAVIESIRNKNERFRFKVQRFRPSSKLSQASDFGSFPDKLHMRESFSTVDMNYMHSDDDTESDYSDLDTDDYTELLKIEKTALKPTQPDIVPPLGEESMASPLSPGIDLSVNEVSATRSRTSSVRTTTSSGQETNSDRLKFAKVTKTSVVYKTTNAPTRLNDYSWKNEKFNLETSVNDKYLNIRFWFASKNQPMAEYSPAKLMGNLAIPLFEIEMQSRLTTSHRITRQYKITPPLKSLLEFRSRLSETFRHRSGFRLEYCFGDTTIIMTANQPCM